MSPSAAPAPVDAFDPSDVDLFDPVALTKALCAVPSVTGDEAAAAARMQALLERLGFAVERQPLSDTRFNLIARTEARLSLIHI